MNRIPLDIGRVAVSLAGRDEGRPFLVVGEIDESFVLIADGDLRKIAKPKKKRRKHLKATKYQIETVRQGKPLQDFEIRQSLSAMQPSEEEG